MAHLLNAEGITVTLAARDLLNGVSLGLDDGDRVGVVGRNGDGKSTLMSLLARQRRPDSGRVTHSRGIDLGALTQIDELDPKASIRTAVVGDVPDHTWAADPRIRDVIVGLLGGLDARGVGGLDATVGRLSGGQRRRVALAALLTGPHDVLLLDEPTNHLDVEGVAWLAEHLQARWPAGRGALAVITHDRWFLDAVCTSMWEVHDAIVEPFEGGYAAYVLARAERQRVAAVTEERRQNLLRKELAWLRRGPPARTSKPQFRIDAATALIADEPAPRDTVALTRMATTRLGKDVIDLEDVTLALGSGPDRKIILDGVTWRVGPGDRFGVVGVNGSGKTTLLRLMLGVLRPDGGRLRIGKTVSSAILSQDLHELDDLGHLRVQEAVSQVKGSVMIGGKEVGAGQLLERLGFTKNRVWTPVSELSGGERRRLQLLRLLMAEPNVLMLDEPTNDLDTDTLASVEDTLDGWPGTLIVVSHDRYLLERVCDRQVALLGDGKVRDLPGGVEEYLQLRRSAPTEGGAAKPVGPRGDHGKSAAPNGGKQPTSHDHGAAGAPGGARSAGAAEQRAARKEMTKLERQIEKLTAREAALHEEMAHQGSDHQAVLALDEQLRAVLSDRQQAEERWLEAAETVG